MKLIRELVVRFEEIDRDPPTEIEDLVKLIRCERVMIHKNVHRKIEIISIKRNKRKKEMDEPNTIILP